VSYDLQFLSKRPVDHAALSKHVRKWAETTPHLTLDLEYNNPDTLVHGLFDMSSPNGDDEDEPLWPPGLHATGCSAEFNYLRPSFFADELTPVAVDLAKAIGAVLYDPQDDKVFEPDEFATENPYRRHLRKINNHFALREKREERPYQVNGALLDAFWRHNRGKAELQQQLGENVFVPTMLLVGLKGQEQPTTAFTWVRAIPMAFEVSGIVVLLRERKGWFKNTTEFRIAPFEAFHKAVASHLSSPSGHNSKHLLSSESRSLDASFDRMFDALPIIGNLSDAMPTQFDNLMNVVDVSE